MGSSIIQKSESVCVAIAASLVNIMPLGKISNWRFVFAKYSIISDGA